MHWNRLRLAEDLNQTDKTDVYRLCRSILSRNETMRLDNKENKFVMTWNKDRIYAIATRRWNYSATRSRSDTEFL